MSFPKWSLSFLIDPSPHARSRSRARRPAPCPREPRAARHIFPDLDCPLWRDASMAQWQSTDLVSLGSWVRSPVEAFFVPPKIAHTHPPLIGALSPFWAWPEPNLSGNKTKKERNSTNEVECGVRVESGVWRACGVVQRVWSAAACVWSAGGDAQKRTSGRGIEPRSVR